MGRRRKKPLMGKYALSSRPAQQESPGIEVKFGRDIWTDKSVTVKAFDVAKFEKQHQQQHHSKTEADAAAGGSSRGSSPGGADDVDADAAADGACSNNYYCRGGHDGGGGGDGDAVVGLFRELIKFEVATLSKTNGHPNVVELVDVLASPGGNKIFVVMETVSGKGDLFEVIAAGGG